MIFVRLLKNLAGEEKSSAVLLPSLIRFGGGAFGGVMLLYVASLARTEPQYSLFIYLQNLAVMIATISKMGVDTLIIVDAEREFRLGARGSSLLLTALIVCTLSFAGVTYLTTSLAVLCLSALTVQNALKAALATREAQYMRAAVESAWVLPSVLIYVLARQGKAQSWEIAAVAVLLLILRIDHALVDFLFGETRGGFHWKRLSLVWLFQVLNIGLFRLDQTLVAAIGTRGGGTKATADLLFWAKANDLSNAVATALGGVANREEMGGRSRRTVINTMVLSRGRFSDLRRCLGSPQPSGATVLSGYGLFFHAE